MACVADLTENTNSPTGTPMLNVGWLGAGHEFTTGPVEQDIVDELVLLADDPHNVGTGVHDCEFCDEDSPILVPAPVKWGEVYLGYGELRVEGPDGTVYSAPSLVIHYILDHGYQPPQQFLDAVWYAADLRSRLVEVKAEMWSFSCAEHNHPFEGPMMPHKWTFVRNRDGTYLAVINLHEPWVGEVYDLAKEAATWNPSPNDAAQLGHAALEIALDPAPDGSRLARDRLPRCPIDGSAPSNYGPCNPMKFVQLQVPTATHRRWDHMAHGERLRLIREASEQAVVTAPTFTTWLRPGLAEVEAKRYLSEVIEPKTDRELMLTTRRRFVTKYVFDYNTREFVDTGDPQYELTGHGQIVVDKFTGQITIADTDLPLEDQVEHPEYEFFGSKQLHPSDTPTVDEIKQLAERAAAALRDPRSSGRLG